MSNKTFSNLWGAAKAHFYHKNRNEEKNTLIIVENNNQIERVSNDIEFFIKGSSPLHLPSFNHAPYEMARPIPSTSEKRVNSLHQLINTKKNNIVITNIYSAAMYLPPKSSFESSIITIEKGKSFDREELKYYLELLGYVNVEFVNNSGEYSFRGDIFDIFPVNRELPVRIELFDDEVETSYTYNIENQKKIKNENEITLLPAIETIVDIDELKRLDLGEEFADQVELYGKFAGFHWFAGKIYKNKSGIFDYFNSPPDIYFFMDDPEGNIDSFYTWLENSLSESEYFEITDSFYQKNELLKIFNQTTCIKLAELSSASDKVCLEYHSPKVRMNFERNNPYQSMNNFIALSKPFVDKNVSYIIATESHKFTEIIYSFFKDHSIEIEEIDTISSIKKSGYYLHKNIFSGSMICDTANISIINDEDLFGFSKKRGTKKKSRVFNTSLADLENGDFVVHVDFGIGIFRGLTHKTIGGVEADYIEIEYEENEILIVPIESVGMIQKYVGSGGSDPKLSSLKSAKWKKLKEQAERSAKRIAIDLLKLYAERKAREGFSFSDNSDMIKTLEETFEYEETEDQLSAIIDVYKDMESGKPMERLICGDVGFGKTEVAVRAACKAVAGGKQVGILCPTTILARQHNETFKKRFSTLPVNIEFISRFRKPKEIKETLNNLRNGKVDILIGTHRLISNDVEFKDLGLLVIDEEQRFGVAHKEKIKNIRSNIDVLSMSATPIPRTLQLSMSGVRDISVIETPPEERLPVITKVIKDDGEIKQSILHELKRGGQVYFLHNDVRNIDETATWLRTLVPGAEIAVAHGQMDSDKMEKIIDRFYSGEINILVVSTIIENGIDVPNANTIIINNAERFGLSQLYQLKGRVGRSNKRGYCYLVLKRLISLNPVAKKRLKIIQQLSELGSGFKIASYDLQLRGAGDMLGAEQSGFAISVGYELYMQMIENAVNEIKGILKDNADTEIQSSIPYFIPAEYIPDPNIRINYYSRISEIESTSVVDDYYQELMSLYGEVPLSVENLLKIMLIKNISSKAAVKKITIFSTKIRFLFHENASIDAAKILDIVKKNNMLVNFSGSYEMILSAATSHDIFTQAITLMSSCTK